MTIDAVKAGLLLFAAAIIQVSIMQSITVFGAAPNLLLVTLLSIALLRGALFGAVCGFFAGLVLDTATLGTLGLTSLLLTVGAYWIGRYGETTGRDRAHAPYVSVAVVTVLYALGALGLHFMLGDAVSARVVLVDALVPGLIFNLLLTAPVYAVTRRLLPPRDWSAERSGEVSLLG
ncbi:MAG: rod shape-determining protein MreD [Gaiellaceae bacterium]